MWLFCESFLFCHCNCWHEYNLVAGLFIEISNWILIGRLFEWCLIEIRSSFLRNSGNSQIFFIENWDNAQSSVALFRLLCGVWKLLTVTFKLTVLISFWCKVLLNKYTTGIDLWFCIWFVFKRLMNEKGEGIIVGALSVSRFPVRNGETSPNNWLIHDENHLGDSVRSAADRIYPFKPETMARNRYVNKNIGLWKNEYENFTQSPLPPHTHGSFVLPAQIDMRYWYYCIKAMAFRSIHSSQYPLHAFSRCCSVQMHRPILLYLFIRSKNKKNK